MLRTLIVPLQHQYGKVGVFETDYKGRGLEALEDMEP